MKYQVAVITLAAAALNLAACSHYNSTTDLPPGKYQSNSSSMDANGTSYDRDTTTTVGYDANGNKRAVVQKKTTIDPPGLFNKSTTESDQVIQQQ